MHQGGAKTRLSVLNGIRRWRKCLKLECRSKSRTNVFRTKVGSPVTCMTRRSLLWLIMLSKSSTNYSLQLWSDDFGPSEKSRLKRKIFFATSQTALIYLLQQMALIGFFLTPMPRLNKRIDGLSQDSNPRDALSTELPRRGYLKRKIELDKLGWKCCFFLGGGGEAENLSLSSRTLNLMRCYLFSEQCQISAWLLGKGDA